MILLKLKIVYSHKFLVTSIKNLESDSLSTEDQVSILKDVEHLAESKNIYADRLKEIFLRNPDLDYFRNFNALRSSEEDKAFCTFH